MLHSPSHFTPISIHSLNDGEGTEKISSAIHSLSNEEGTEKISSALASEGQRRTTTKVERIARANTAIAPGTVSTTKWYKQT